MNNDQTPNSVSQLSLTGSEYITSRPSCTHVLDAVFTAIEREFVLTNVWRDPFHATFTIDARFRFGVLITPMQKSIGDLTRKYGAYNWNGRWMIELRHGEFSEPLKSWRPHDGKLDTALRGIVDAIQVRAADAARFDGSELRLLPRASQPSNTTNR